MQCLAQIFRAVEAVRLPDLLKPAVEPLDHAVGLLHSWFSEPAFDIQVLVYQVKFMLC
jgi:hypothetical protein